MHEKPLFLVLPFPLHQVSENFPPLLGADLVHEKPLSLVIPFPLHQVSENFPPLLGADLVHEKRDPCASVFFAPSSREVSAGIRRELGAQFVKVSTTMDTL